VHADPNGTPARRDRDRPILTTSRIDHLAGPAVALYDEMLKVAAHDLGAFYLKALSQECIAGGTGDRHLVPVARDAVSRRLRRELGLGRTGALSIGLGLGLGLGIYDAIEGPLLIIIVSANVGVLPLSLILTPRVSRVVR